MWLLFEACYLNGNGSNISSISLTLKYKQYKFGTKYSVLWLNLVINDLLLITYDEPVWIWVYKLIVTVKVASHLLRIMEVLVSNFTPDTDCPQHSKTNKMHFLYSIYYELTASTCFKHYLLIFRSGTPILVAANRHNTHAIYRMWFVQRPLKMSK
jgi:hypothetical protein